MLSVKTCNSFIFTLKRGLISYVQGEQYCVFKKTFIILILLEIKIFVGTYQQPMLWLMI